MNAIRTVTVVTSFLALAALVGCSSDSSSSGSTSTAGAGGANAGGASAGGAGGMGTGGMNMGGSGGMNMGGSGGMNMGGAGGMNTGGAGGGMSALCVSSGGTPTEGMCCKAAGSFPNMCGEGACGCSAQESQTTALCSCPNGQCYDPAQGCVPVGGQGGAGGGAPTSLCVKTGGTETTGLCCLGTPDFPEMCSVGPCGCDPKQSATVKTCECPQGQCYDMTNGCVAHP